jgi:two-component system, chemotaxis family, protein-glutamate methylesterase/glutaminase
MVPPDHSRAGGEHRRRRNRDGGTLVWRESGAGEVDVGRRDIVVVGASAGGVTALQDMTASLVSGLDAAVFVVLHLPPTSRSELPGIMTRAGPLRAIHPRDGDPIRKGMIFVAPPDRHIVLERSRIRLSHGPRENHHRPAADPLFRSAAQTFGDRVVGVVMSGALDDGTAGLSAIVAAGGHAIVQDPHEAQHGGMVESALRNVAVDEVLTAAKIGDAVVRLSRQPSRPARSRAMNTRGRDKALPRARDPGAFNQAAGLVCPDCNGSLWQVPEGNLVRFECHVGHLYSPISLAAAQAQAVESALWGAAAMLRERTILLRHLAQTAEQGGDAATSARYLANARDHEREAGAVEAITRASSPERDTAVPKKSSKSRSRRPRADLPRVKKGAVGSGPPGRPRTSRPGRGRP